ncbi:MAG TPA: hypothetical protein VHM30_03575 [Gemmatimonadaceae bacterium]|nr:hypothetical protein [Gemmatimonadaceae bacterium]
MRFPPTVRHLAPRLALGAALLLAARGAGAQRPDLHWRTLATTHFRVHFTARTEEVARHAATSAEWAYDALARELVPPRGLIELVVSDDVDFSNGFTTTFPTNRIVIYTQPPVDEPSLRDYDDWITLVVTHELTHVFHLDRVRGFWAAMQLVFGRNPYLFPANYEPRWVAEGLAVYFESRVTGAGRIVGTGHRAVARAAAAGGRSPRLGDLSVARTSFPGGGGVYVFGSLVFDELARTRGAAGIRRYIEYTSAYILPFQLNRTAHAAFGESFSTALKAVNDSAARMIVPQYETLGTWRLLASGFDAMRAPRLQGEAIVFGADRGKEMPGAYRVDTTGALQRIGRRTTAGVNDPLPDGGILTAQLEFTSPYEIRSDLYVQRGRRLHRLTNGARLDAPDARADGEIVAVQSITGTTVLARVSRDGRTIRPITSAAPDTQWTQPRWSPDGHAIAAVKLVRGRRSQIVVLDSLGAQLALVADEEGSVSASPAWTDDGQSILFTSDRSGRSELYVGRVRWGRTLEALDSIFRLSSTNTALADPLELTPPGPAGLRRLAVAELRANGWALGTGLSGGATAIEFARKPTVGGEPPVGGEPARPKLPMGRDSSASHPYHAFRQLLPRYWLPIAYNTDDSTLVLGAATSGNDVLGRHSYYASAEASTRWQEYGGAFSYEWAGLGMPLLDVGASQAWEGAGIVVDKATQATLGYVRRRTRTMSGGLRWSRPRTRYALAASALGGVETRDYTTHPFELRDVLSNTSLDRTHRRPFVLGALAGSNVQSPRRSISVEDGLSAYGSGERLWDRDERAGGHTRLVGSLAGYKSLDLPGYAHHVLALRVAGGWTDSEDGRELSVGGVPSDFATIGATSIGGTSDFPMRGFIDGALSGTRALVGSLEYRAPLLIPARGATLLFLDRTSVSLFADAATAWCGDSTAVTDCASGTKPVSPLVSVGGELVLDLAIFYDLPLTVRVGAAKALGAFAKSPLTSNGVYVGIGRSF